MEHAESMLSVAACKLVAGGVQVMVEVHEVDVALEESMPHHRQFLALPCFLKNLEVELEETAMVLALHHRIQVDCRRLSALPCSPTATCICS